LRQRPRTHRVGTADELVGNVRVHAFDAIGSPTWGTSGILDVLVTVARRTVSLDRAGEPLPKAGITIESIIDFVHRTLGLERSDPLDQHGARQPKRRRERRAVVKAGMVLDHHGYAEMTTARNRPLPAQSSSELRRNDELI
jgi:hypothetical protein